MALHHATSLPHAYRSWQEYGRGYMEGHLEYRRHQGDDEHILMDYRQSIQDRLADKHRNVWSGIRWPG